MKRIVINLIICSVCGVGVYGQHQTIPNKANAIIWYDSEQQEDKANEQTLVEGMIKSSAKMSSVRQEDSCRLLNFHRVKTFEQGQSAVKTPCDVKNFSRLTVIVVYHSPDTLEEHGIWSVHSGKGQLSGLTDRRLLRQKSEYVYPVKRRGIPLINTSMQSFPKNREKTDSNYFVLGETLLGDSGKSYFLGDIAEYLVFDRFLKKTEALKIETNLAIKYGISLIESDYLSSSECILWNYEENREFSNGIAGIGKDSVLGLSQCQGSSSEEEDLLSIGIGNFTRLNTEHPNVVPEGNYLVWGHNEGSMGNEPDCAEEYPLWERKWMLQASYTDTTKRFSTTIKIRIPEENRDTTRLNYLVIDRSGNGDFTSTMTDYIPQSKYDTSGYAYFHDVVWDRDGSGKDVFSFSYGASMDTVIEASCPNNANGSLSVRMCGGKAPFHYLLEDSTGEQYSYHGGRNCIFNELFSGIYRFVVRDSQNTVISQTIEIPAWASEELELPSKYWLTSPSGEEIDAREYNNGNFVNYVWEKDSVLLRDSAMIEITKPGRYKLTVTDSNGCISTSEMEVEELILSKGSGHKSREEGESQSGAASLEETPSFRYKVYPNPTEGSYRVEVDLAKESPVRIRLFTVKGDLLEEWTAKGKTYYSFDSWLDIQGNYIIEVETSFGIEDFKLTVVK
jgi:hypothetical protein